MMVTQSQSKSHKLPQLDVSEDEVISMNQRMAGNDRHNVPLNRDAEGGGEWQDWLEDDSLTKKPICRT